MEEKIIKMVIYYVLAVYEKKNMESCIEIINLIIAMVKNEETKADRLLNNFPIDHPVSKLYKEIKKTNKDEFIKSLKNCKEKFIDYKGDEVDFSKIENEKEVEELSKKILK